ncbi:MAG: hypothetical protein KBD01_16595 [Acidobacteria bacterium]|nr:hypothetical protein [Acidobacteriota bacterium]
MRKFLPILLLPALLGANPAPEPPPDGEVAPAAAARPVDPELARLRSAWSGATDPALRERAARELLAALDRGGASSDGEAARLVDELLAQHPDDAQLLWRRAEARRRSGNAAGAVADLERLVQLGGASPEAVRARRALPQLYLRLNRHADSARADEQLLELQLADPVPVLARLARTYAALGRASDVRATIERLGRIDPARLRGDADLAWLAADATDRLGTPEEAAAAMSEFAERFPGDRRRGEALLRAARGRAAAGQLGSAASLANAAAQETPGRAISAEAQIARGEYLEKLGQLAEAQEAYRAALGARADATTAQRALTRLVDLEIQARGVRSGLALLARLGAPGPGGGMALARKHFDALLAIEIERPNLDPTQAALLDELARRVDPKRAPPAALRLAAAAFWERVGAADKALATYKELAETPGAQQEPARAGLARLSQAAAGDRGRELLVRADELSVAGDHEGACQGYRLALPEVEAEPELSWLDVRLASCELREGDREAARARLERVLARKPGEPAALAAEMLLRRAGGSLPAGPAS